MNFRQTAILLGAILVVGVVLLVMSYTAEDNTPDAGALTAELAGVKPEQVDSVEIEREGGGKLKMVRAGADKKTWEIVEPYHAPANPDAVEVVISSLMKARPVAHPELSSSLAAHGLEPPSLKVTLRQGDKASTVNLGNVSIGGSKGVVFVTTSARPNRPMAVPRGDLDALFKESKPGKAGDIAKWVGDYRAHSIFPGDSRALGEDVSYLKLDLPNKKKELVLSRSAAGGWKFDVPAGWGEADSEGDPAASLGTFTGVNPLVRALTTMSASSAADFLDGPGDLKQYGLNPDNPDLVRAEVRSKDGRTVVAFIGKQEAAAAPPPPAPGMPPHPPSGGKAYVRVEGQPGVIRATAGNLSGLVPVIADPSPLRERALVALDPRKRVDGIDILLPGQPADKPTKVRRVGTDWKLYGGPGDPRSAFAAPVERIVEVVTAHRAINGFPAPNPANFASVSATLSVWVDGFNPPASPGAEPAKKSEPVKLEFGRKEGDSVHVRRTRPGNVVSEFTVPAMLRVGGGTETVDVLATVTKSRLDLLDRSLPSFSEASRVAVSGAANYTLAQDEKPAPGGEKLWHFVAPDPRAGKVADAAAVRNDILYYLANASSQFGHFVEEAPPAAKLAEYGFTPNPTLKATVDLPPGGATKQIVYEFGKDAPDPNYVYARLGGKAEVFTLGKVVRDKLTNVDLRDRAVFRDVPLDKVDEVELKGWGGITLKFQKNKDGVWAAQPPTPTTFAADPGKVAAFLQLLGRTQVKEFQKGPPTKEHGFGDPKHYLQVILRWPGGTTTLNIGAPTDGGQSYYVWSALLPKADPVFTVEAGPFKSYKEGPGGFAK